MSTDLLIPSRYADVQTRAAEVEDVDADSGTILLRAAPYDVETPISPTLFEEFAPGTFARAAAAPHRSKMWHLHGGPLIGHAIEIDDRADGSWVKARFSNTVAGQEARELAHDGTLDQCSVEFRPMREHMTVRRDDRGMVHVRHTKAHLLGVALVPHGAYAEYAMVASVRDDRDKVRDETLARLHLLAH